MKRRFYVGAASAALSAALLFSNSGMVLAEEPSAADAGKEMMELMTEISSQTDFQMSETIVYHMDGVQTTISIQAVKGETGITDCDVALQILIPEEETMEILLEDLFRMLPDGCYINLGAIFDAAETFAGNNVVEQFAKMLGIREPWIRISYQEETQMLTGQAAELLQTMNRELTEAISGFATEETEGCYEITFDSENYADIMEATLKTIDENFGEWMTGGIELAKAIDLETAVNDYAKAVVRGIQFVDPSFDSSVVFDAVSDVNSEYQAFFAEADSESLAEEMKAALAAELGEEAEGLDISAENLRSLMEESGMMINGAWSLQKDNDAYLISYNESIMDEDTSAAVSVVASMVPCDPVIAEAPESFMEAEEAAEELAASIYAAYYLYEGELLEDYHFDYIDDMDDTDYPDDTDDTYDIDDTDDTDEGYDETDSELLMDGNRFYIEDYYGLNGCWVEYDDTALSLDMDFSDSQSVFYDMKEPDNYNYIYLSIKGETSFQEEYEINASMYEEFYESYTISEIQTSEAGQVPIQYAIVDYVTEDGYEFSQLWFGVDLENGGCLFGDMDLEEDNDLETIISIMHQAVMDVQM